MMSRHAGRLRWLCLAMAAVLAGCFHTRHVADKGGEENQTATTGKTEHGASQRVTPKRIPPRGDRPAVSANPEGLMNPGSARKIQDALHRRGYLDEVSG